MSTGGPPLGPPRGPNGPPPGPNGPPPGPNGPPPGPLVPPPNAPSSARPRTARIVLVTLLAVLVLAAAIGAVVVLLGDDEAGASEVFLEPVGARTDNPFAPSVVTTVDGESAEKALEPLDDAGGTFTADTVGLYGGTQDESTCDRAQLVEFLEANDAEAAAWAGVLGIEVADIAAYVDTLTPFVLRSDTAVTNHGFVDGRATTIPAVLQAGTAVLVDDRGQPVVKCGCGNPLTPPAQTQDVDYVGTPWDGFDPVAVTVIQPVTVRIDVFVAVDLSSGASFGRPAGTAGDDDGPPPDDPTGGATTTTEAPETTTTTTAGGVPDQATYELTATVQCPGEADTSGSITATVSDGTLTLTAINGTVTGPIGPDGSFQVSDTVATFDGVVTADAITGTLSGQDCTGTIEGPRTG